MVSDYTQLPADLKDTRRIAIAGLSRSFNSPANEVAVYPKINGNLIKQTRKRLLQAKRLWC
jgi:predicted CoA-binding protein